MENEGFYSDQEVEGLYKVGARLGKGGMGEVYSGYRVAEYTPIPSIAIKFLQDTLDPVAYSMFYKEWETHKTLQHPNIIPVYRYGAFESKGMQVPYIVMAFAPEGSLYGHIAKYGKLDIEKAIPLPRQISEGLQYAHTKGVLHRDIKPQNILLDREPISKQLVAMLCDFGITVTAHRLNSFPNNLTTLGKNPFAGTATYMSPEQFDDIAFIPSDIYSLGVMAYQLLTGKLPFNGKGVIELAFAHKTNNVPSFEQVEVKMNILLESVEGVVRKALSKDPSDRYQSADEFGYELYGRFVAAKEKKLREQRVIDLKEEKVRQKMNKSNKPYFSPVSDFPTIKLDE